MFNWLVKKMNVTIEPADWTDEDFHKRAKTIGLLDIFGFENFKHNNFEQLCINYVNEKLHKLYIAAIFEAEKMELIDEGLESIVSRIQYPNLKVLEVIKMLDYKPNSKNYAGVNFAEPPGTGIFTHLDDVCQTGRPVKWEEIADAVETTHKKSNVFRRDKKVRFNFFVSHSAQEVKYDMKEFSERNMDFIPAGLENAMCTQTDVHIQRIYKQIVNDDEELKSQAPSKTIWSKFTNHMTDLMEELAEPLLRMGEEKSRKVSKDQEETQLHFIRCIKPRPKPESENDRSGLFVHSMTLQ